MFISVLLPAPFSPSRAWISPDRSSKSTWSWATTPGNALTIPAASSAATDAEPAASAGADAGSGRGPGRGSPGEGGGAAVIATPLDGWCPAAGGARGRISYGLLGQDGQVARDPFVPPVHARRARVPRGPGRELVEVGLLELLAVLEKHLAGVVGQRAGEHVEP